MKHIFETDNLVFIIATDTDQLRHSVRAIYGNDFDSERYLMRFFDRSYEFEEPLISEFVRLQCEDHGLTDLTTLSLPPKIALEVYLTGCFRYFGLSLRDVDQCMDIFRSVVSAWDHPRLPIQVCALMPLIVAFQQRKLSSTDEATLSSLEQLHSEGRGRKVEWKLPFNVRAAFANKIEPVSGVNLTNEMLHIAKDTLPKIMNNPAKNSWRQWIKTQFEKEFEALHNYGYSNENESYSILTQYSDFIRSASRLIYKAIGDRQDT